ncbi:MAG: hypothetical protein ACLQVF_40880 [Isosphaeraceae bacterium]
MSPNREQQFSQLIAARREYHARQRVATSAKIAWKAAQRKLKHAAEQVEKTLQAIESGQSFLPFGQGDGEDTGSHNHAG